MRIVAVIQARMGSSRLPGKVMKPIAGKPLIEHVVERVKAVSGLAEVVLATTNNEEDDRLCFEAHRLHCVPIRGYVVLADGRNDVLSRYAQAARATKADVILRITADCPLWCPLLGGEVLGAYLLNESRQYASNVHPKVDGFDTQVMSRDLLERADREVMDANDRHHVCPWMHRRDGIYVNHVPKVGGYKLSVDTPEDFLLATKILERVKAFSWVDTIAATECAELASMGYRAKR